MRVLIVDDSAAVRRALQDVIESDPALSVMGAASDPIRAAHMISKERPDVITLDVEMPHMDGLTFLKKIMSQHPIPVVMCSAHLEANSARLIDALAAGAVDIIQKPKLGAKQYLEETKEHICAVIKTAGHARPTVWDRMQHHTTGIKPCPKPRRQTSPGVIAIGASTGGTEAVAKFLQDLPPNCPPIVVVQHMPQDFTKPFAERLDNFCAPVVKEAECGDHLIQGRVLIAPGGIHTLIIKDGIDYAIELREGPIVSGHMPSIDVLFSVDCPINR